MNQQETLEKLKCMLVDEGFDFEKWVKEKAKGKR
jgi:hypothetical protein